MKTHHLFLILALLLPACGTTTGNSGVSSAVSVEIGSLAAALVLRAGKPWKSHAGLTTLRVCLTKVVLSNDDGETRTYEFTQETVLSDSGILAAAIDVPKSTYTHLEFEVEDRCGTGHSWIFSNTKGKSFSSTAEIGAAFDGTFELRNDRHAIALDMKEILEGLDGVASDDEVKGAVERKRGRGALKN